MVFEALAQLATGFEGCEKKLKLDFTSNKEESSLRRIPRKQIDHFLSIAKCTVISHIIIKTCGTTSLLQCLPTIITYADAQGFLEPPVVQFSRTNFMFPKKQPFPHRSFDMEAKYLDTVFKGAAQVLGPMSGPRWHLYTAGSNIRSSDCTFEMVMFKLDRSAMACFYNDKEGSFTNENATNISGIDQIIPGATIDAHLFDPCGYSCNGMKDETYFTIHVTPEPECSFVSFETNLKLDSYDGLVQKVLSIFKPGAFLVSILADTCGFENSISCMKWKMDGYTNNGTTSHMFSDGGNVAVGQFVQKIAPLSPYQTKKYQNKLRNLQDLILENNNDLENMNLEHDEEQVNVHDTVSDLESPISCSSEDSDSKDMNNDLRSPISCTSEVSDS